MESSGSRRDGAPPAVFADTGLSEIVTLHAHLVNIVVRAGRPVKFDANLERALGNEAAERLPGRGYREHWATPKTT